MNRMNWSTHTRYVMISLCLLAEAPLVAQNTDHGLGQSPVKSAFIWQEDNRASWRCSVHMDLDSLAQRIGQDQALRSTDPGKRARYFELLADLHIQRVQWEPALNAADSAIQAYSQAKDVQGVGRAELRKGEVLMWAGDHVGAAEALEAALDKLARSNDHGSIGDAHRLLGRIHYIQQQFTASLTHYRKALAEYRMGNDPVGIAQTYNAIAVASIESKTLGSQYYEVGMAYYDSALTAAHRAGCTKQLARIHNNVALIHIYNRNELGIARTHLDSALYYAGKSGDTLLYHSTRHTEAVFLVHAGKYREAMRLCEQVLHFAQRRGAALLQRDALECMSNALKNQGLWEQAYSVQEAYYRLRDSSYNMSSREAILKRSVEHESERRRYADSLVVATQLEEARTQTTLARMRSERDRNRTLGLGGGTLLLMIGGVLYYRIDRKRRRDRHERDAAELERKAVEAELKALRAQMNPHFLYNALASLGEIVLANEGQRAYEHLTKFAKLMRLVLENSREPVVPLAKDLEALTLYMDMERAHRGEGFEHTITLAEQVDPDRMHIQPLLLQPFVENAIRHGLSAQQGKGHIAIAIEARQQHLFISIEDDGSGMRNRDGHDGHTSLGTLITGDRLRMAGQLDGDRGIYRYVEVPKGVRVELMVPFSSGPYA